MNAEQRENFRKAILCSLDDNNQRVGLNIKALTMLVGSYGFPSTDPKELKAELGYLEDKGLVAEVLKGISPENPSWRITAEGRDFVAKLQNL